ncbi:hypothetical protein [Neobacillus sp. NPDC093127]|uniref:hypothetical protein n=1 Tax=Neobacillus sp. NPDC093127 TaxID=3364296 RepID=UPI0037FD084A
MADIKDYKIIKEVSTSNHLIVYLVENKENHQTAMVRLINHQEHRDAWKELYRYYGRTITNTKYLPALKRIDILADCTFAVLDGSAGNLLESGQILSSTQIDQFLEALVHVHHNGILFGKITRFNIWIRENGNLTIYGSGERAVLYPDSRPTIQADIKQAIQMLKAHSDIDASYFNRHSFETMEELQEWVLAKLAIPKPGIVAKGETAQTIFPETSKKERTSGEQNEKVLVIAPAPKQSEQPKHPLARKGFIAALLIIVIAGVVAFSLISGGDKPSLLKANQSSQTRKSTPDGPKTVETEKDNQTVSAQEKEPFTALFPDWEIVKQAAIKVTGMDYIIIGTAKSREDSQGVVKVSVLSKVKSGDWTKVWESTEYKGHASEPKGYIDSFITIPSKEAEAALIVLGLPDGSIGISEVIALTLDGTGRMEQVWNDYGTKIEQTNNVVSVQGVGLTKLSLQNGKFALEKQ